MKLVPKCFDFLFARKRVESEANTTTTTLVKARVPTPEKEEKLVYSGFFGGIIGTGAEVRK